MPPTRGLRFVGNLPRLSRREFGTGFIAHRAIGQIRDRNRIPVRDELFGGPFSAIEEVAASPHLARQTGPSGGRAGIHDPTVIVPFLRRRTVPLVVFVQAPSFGGLACRWHGDNPPGILSGKSIRSPLTTSGFRAKSTSQIRGGLRPWCRKQRDSQIDHPSAPFQTSGFTKRTCGMRPKDNAAGTLSTCRSLTVKAPFSRIRLRVPERAVRHRR
jgi:hypothetical protein